MEINKSIAKSATLWIFAIHALLLTCFFTQKRKTLLKVKNLTWIKNLKTFIGPAKSVIF